MAIKITEKARRFDRRESVLCRILIFLDPAFIAGSTFGV
jgi:hypothetical protein